MVASGYQKAVQHWVLDSNLGERFRAMFGPFVWQGQIWPLRLLNGNVKKKCIFGCYSPL